MQTVTLSFVNMDTEYWKAIISVLAGFITAFYAEPFKIYFTNKSKINNLRKALYSEIVVIYDRLFHYLIAVEGKGLDIDIAKVVNTDFDCYKYAKSDPSLFYRLEEAVMINQFYNNVHLLKQEDTETNTESKKSIQVAKLVVLQMEVLLASNKLDKKLILEVAKDLGLNDRIRRIINNQLPAGEATAVTLGKK